MERNEMAEWDTEIPNHPKFISMRTECVQKYNRFIKFKINPMKLDVMYNTLEQNL